MSDLRPMFGPKPLRTLAFPADYVAVSRELAHRDDPGREEHRWVSRSAQDHPQARSPRFPQASLTPRDSISDCVRLKKDTSR